jgi:hypothetical protein
LSFPDQSSIAKWLIKEKKDIFETLSVPLLDYYTPHNKIVGGYTGFTMTVRLKFQNILRNTTQIIIRHRVKILFSVTSSPITLERQKWKSSKMKGKGEKSKFCFKIWNISHYKQVFGMMQWFIFRYLAWSFCLCKMKQQ